MNKSTPEPADPEHAPRLTFWVLLIGVCVALIVAGSMIQKESAHHFPIQDLPFYPAWIGLAGGLLAVIIAKIVGKLIQTREDYYDEDDSAL